MDLPRPNSVAMRRVINRNAHVLVSGGIGLLIAGSAGAAAVTLAVKLADIYAERMKHRPPTSRRGVKRPPRQNRP